MRKVHDEVWNFDIFAALLRDRARGKETFDAQPCKLGIKIGRRYDASCPYHQDTIIYKQNVGDPGTENTFASWFVVLVNVIKPPGPIAHISLPSESI